MSNRLIFLEQKKQQARERQRILDHEKRNTHDRQLKALAGQTKE